MVQALTHLKIHLILSQCNKPFLNSIDNLQTNRTIRASTPQSLGLALFSVTTIVSQTIGIVQRSRISKTWESPQGVPMSVPGQSGYHSTTCEDRLSVQAHTGNNFGPDTRGPGSLQKVLPQRLCISLSSRLIVHYSHTMLNTHIIAANFRSHSRLNKRSSQSSDEADEQSNGNEIVHASTLRTKPRQKKYGSVYAWILLYLSLWHKKGFIGPSVTGGSNALCVLSPISVRPTTPCAPRHSMSRAESGTSFSYTGDYSIPTFHLSAKKKSYHTHTPTFLLSLGVKCISLEHPR